MLRIHRPPWPLTRALLGFPYQASDQAQRKPLRCRRHLVQQHRLMPQECIDDPRSHTHNTGSLAHKPACLPFLCASSLLVFFFTIWHMHFRRWCIVIFPDLLGVKFMDFLVCLSRAVNNCIYVSFQLPASVLYVTVWINTAQLQDVNGPHHTYEIYYFSTLV